MKEGGKNETKTLKPQGASGHYKFSYYHKVSTKTADATLLTKTLMPTSLVTVSTIPRSTLIHLDQP
jgi:hypothetical protein